MHELADEITLLFNAQQKVIEFLLWVQIELLKNMEREKKVLHQLFRDWWKVFLRLAQRNQVGRQIFVFSLSCNHLYSSAIEWRYRLWKAPLHIISKEFFFFWIKRKFFSEFFHIGTKQNSREFSFKANLFIVFRSWNQFLSNTNVIIEMLTPYYSGWQTTGFIFVSFLSSAWEAWHVNSDIDCDLI